MRVPLAYALLSGLIAMMLSLEGRAEAESFYRDMWCAEWRGAPEVILYNATRVDCITEEFAVEVDWAPKWAESIGQALLYANLTGKAPAVLLITRDGEHRFLARWHNAAEGLGIRLFVVDY